LSICLAIWTQCTTDAQNCYNYIALCQLRMRSRDKITRHSITHIVCELLPWPNLYNCRIFMSRVAMIMKMQPEMFLADRTNGRAYATLLRPSVVVCRL